MAKDQKKDRKGALKGNALSSLMGGGPPPKPKVASDPKVASGSPRPTRTSNEEAPRRGASVSRSRGDAVERQSEQRTAERSTTRTSRETTRDGGEEGHVDPGYVGASTYERKGRGEVKKVAFYLSPEVAAALREAGFRGTEHGENMSEIVETLLRENGYGS